MEGGNYIPKKTMVQRLLVKIPVKAYKTSIRTEEYAGFYYLVIVFYRFIT